MKKSDSKLSAEELQKYLMLTRRHHIIPSKKGKGSYKRKQKHRGEYNAE